MQYFYKVPWCVPAWGAGELRETALCILGGSVSRGRSIEAFAGAVKGYLGLPYALPVNRGKTAIELALIARGVGAGDDVVMPSYICSSVMEAVLAVGACPVFADVGEDLNVTAASVKAAMTPRTRCVIVAHLFGKAAPIGEIERLAADRKITLIDDAAQSFGARVSGRPVGSFGDFGIVSCGPGKTLAGSGGGLLVTRDEGLYERARQVNLDEEGAAAAGRVISYWMWRRLRRYTLPGMVILERFVGPISNYPSDGRYTLSNIEAAIGFQQFLTMDRNASRRRQNAGQILDALGRCGAYSVSDLSPDNMILKVVLVLPAAGPAPKDMIDILGRAGIECQQGYTPCHLKYGDMPALNHTNDVWRRIVCIPVETEVKAPVMSSLKRELSRRGLY